jgi:hypothetical protein
MAILTPPASKQREAEHDRLGDAVQNGAEQDGQAGTGVLPPGSALSPLPSEAVNGEIPEVEGEGPREQAERHSPAPARRVEGVLD